jgi:hypothetical protein
MFIAVDSEDMAKLADVLLRAVKKEQTLKTRFESTGIKFIDLV